MASPATDVAIGLLPALSLLLTPLLTAWWIRRARRLQLLDAPERRRLHDAPTPRGGGIGPVAAILLVLVVLHVLQPEALSGFALPLIAGLLLAAGVSAADDHRPRSVRLRLAVHLLAATLIAVAFVAGSELDGKDRIETGLLLIAASVASMNLHNFMDGSDAHLASQTLFVFAVLTLLAYRHDAAAAGVLFAATVAAVLAFLPFNWPRARVFLGDVGSISFGFLVAGYSLLAIDHGLIGWGGALILSSAFVVDAMATLVGRMHRTRHWIKPHRSHLYQWLRRRGWHSSRVIAAYQAWNLLVVLPSLWVLDILGRPAAMEFALAAAVYVLGLLVWHVARGALRRSHRAQYRS